MACPRNSTAKAPKSGCKCKTVKPLVVLLHVLVPVSMFGSVLLLTLLAMDVFTIPYLTPFAHALRTLLAPFVPFLAPFILGLFLKFCQHPTFPRKTTWVLISGSWLFQQIQRVVIDIWGLVTEFKYDSTGRTGLDGVEITFCGIGYGECGREWLEFGLLIAVCVAQWRGWKWEGGVIDQWIESLVAQAWKEEKEREGGALNVMEKGEVVAEETVVDEKKGLLKEAEEETANN